MKNSYPYLVGSALTQAGYNQFYNYIVSDGRQRPRYKLRTRVGSVTMPNNDEFTRSKKKKVFGRRTTSTARLLRAAALNQEVITWQFKGIGRPFQYGFYNAEKFSFTDGADTFYALPLYAFDITSCNNVVNTLYYGCCPMMRAYQNVSSNLIEWHPCQSQNSAGAVTPTGALSRTSPDVFLQGATANQWQVLGTTAGTVNSTAVAPHATQYIDTVDIYMNLFSARQVPTTWCVDVCQFDEALAPYNSATLITGNDPTSSDPTWHTAFWMGEMLPYVNHPLNYQRGHRSSNVTTPAAKRGLGDKYPSKGFRSLLKKPVVVVQQPKDTTYSEPSAVTASRMHKEYIRLDLRRAVNMNHQLSPENATARTPIGMDASAATTLGIADSGVSTNIYTGCFPAQDARVFVIIKTNDYEDAAFNNATKAPCRQGAVAGAGFQDAWATKINDIPAEIGTHVDFNKSGSFDLNVIKRMIKDAF